MTDSQHRDWHSRGYIPHRDAPGLYQAITFHLGDSLPQPVLARMEEELLALDESDRDMERRRRIEGHLDAGFGECWLRRPEIAVIVENALLYFDGGRYRLMAWCIMPSHVHFLARIHEGWPLGVLMDSVKDFTARAANKLLGRRGRFWQREYYDRFMRDWQHYDACVRYIERNPVKAHLCRETHEWRWSSGWEGRRKTPLRDEM